MRLRIAPISVDGSHCVATQPFAPSIPSTEKARSVDRHVVCRVVLSSPFRSRKLKSRVIHEPVTRVRTNRSCSASLDEGFDKQHVEGLAKKLSFSADEGRWSSVTSEARPFATDNRMDSSFPSKFEFLEPMMLGIRPEPPDWPGRESIMWISIEQKAKSFDIPFSLRMIKKKQQLERGFKDVGESSLCSVNKALSSMVLILVELQSHALQMREVLCHEDLEMIIPKVQKEMHLSFLWLFQQVFSRTPALMIHVMILLAYYSVHSTSHSVAIAETAQLTSTAKEENESTESIFHTGNNRRSSMSTQNPIREISQVGDKELRNIVEMLLWNSMVDEAERMQSKLRDAALDYDVILNFVSPFSVEIEPDDYMEYHRTDLLYQTGLSQDPNNPLLLCNYAQFLHIVAHDYNRAEECYKRAVQVEPPDAESLSQYANFLWTIRKDFWGAEERYLQALAAEPSNSCYASKYANFLWSTGGDDTCYPLDSSSNENKTLNC